MNSKYLLSLLLTLSLLTCAADAGEIHRLLEDGQVEKAKMLLARDRSLADAVDDHEQTPLHVAAHRGQLEMVKLLLKQGANVNARAYNRFTPLHLAHDPETVRLLLDCKADMEAKDSNGCAALENAACRSTGQNDIPDLKWRKIARLLLDARAYYDIRSAIHLADVERVRALLKKDPKEVEQKHLMRIAAMEGRVAIVKLLLDHKADPNELDYGGLPVLYSAVEHPAVIKLLLDAGVDPKVRLHYHGGGPPFLFSNCTVLEVAAWKGQIESAKLLIRHGVEINSITVRMAVGGGQPEMLKYLLEHRAGAVVLVNEGPNLVLAARSRIRESEEKENEKQNERYRAILRTLQAHRVPIDLLTAIFLRDAQLVADLLKDNPELATKTKDASGKPALHLAVEFDCKKIVGLLLDNGVYVNLTNRFGETALHVAASLGREEVAKLLIERKADLNTKGNVGYTPLHESARMATIEVARLLLRAGASVNALDIGGHTPLYRAERQTLQWKEDSGSVSKRVQEMIELLRKSGGTR